MEVKDTMPLPYSIAAAGTGITAYLNILFLKTFVSCANACRVREAKRAMRMGEGERGKHRLSPVVIFPPFVTLVPNLALLPN